MGSVSFIAVKGVAKAQVLQHLGVVDSGKPVGEFQAPLICAQNAAGWLLLVSNDMDFASPGRAEALSRLAPRARAVACALSSTVMCSEAAGWRDGAELWSIAYDCNRSRGTIQASGRMPPGYGAAVETARTGHEEDGDGVDLVFEIPLDVAAAVCGYHWEEGEDRLAFTELTGPWFAIPDPAPKIREGARTVVVLPDVPDPPDDGSVRDPPWARWLFRRLMVFFAAPSAVLLFLLGGLSARSFDVVAALNGALLGVFVGLLAAQGVQAVILFLAGHWAAWVRRRGGD